MARALNRIKRNNQRGVALWVLALLLFFCGHRVSAFLPHSHRHGSINLHTRSAQLSRATCQNKISFQDPTKAYNHQSLTSLRRKTWTTRSTTSLCLAREGAPPSPDKSGYSDDCFGLIFLGGAAATRDPVFAVVFLALSAIAAILTNAGAPGQAVLPANKRVPGVVAILTLVATFVLSSTGILSSVSSSFVATDDLNPDALKIEAALCAFSFLYSLLDLSFLSDRSKS